MKKGISLAVSILTAVLNFMPVLCVQLGVLALFEMQKTPWPAFLFALLPVCLLVTGSRTGNPAVFLGVTAAAAAVTWLLSAGPAQKVVYLGTLAVCAVIVILNRLDLFMEGSRAPADGGEKAGLQPVTYAVILLCYFIVNRQGGTQGAAGFVLEAYQALAAAEALLYFGYLFLSGFDRCMTADKAAAARQKQVFLTGGFLNLAFLAAAGVILLFSSQLTVPGGVMTGAGGALYAFMSWLVKLIPGSYGKPEDGVSAQPDSFGIASTNTIPPWMEAVLQFTAKAVAAVVCLLVLWLLFRLLRILWQAFIRRAPGSAKEGELFYRDETEDLRREDRKQKKESLPAFARTPEQKIRKTYYRAMLEAKKRFQRERDKEKEAAFLTALQRATVRELGAYFPAGVYGRLAGLYEKARYSGGACSTEDAAAAKRAAKELRAQAVSH